MTSHAKVGMYLKGGAIALAMTMTVPSVASADPASGLPTAGPAASPAFHLDSWWSWLQCVHHLHSTFAAHGVDLFDPDYGNSNMKIIDNWCGGHLE